MWGCGQPPPPERSRLAASRTLSSQTGWKLTQTIDQHDAHSVARFVCPEPSGNFRPLINSCRFVITYWSCLECSKPGFNLECVLLPPSKMKMFRVTWDFKDDFGLKLGFFSSGQNWLHMSVWLVFIKSLLELHSFGLLIEWIKSKQFAETTALLFYFSYNTNTEIMCDQQQNKFRTNLIVLMIDYCIFCNLAINVKLTLSETATVNLIANRWCW